MSGSVGPGPRLIFWNRAVSSSMSRSWTGAWTSSRDPAEQVCPAFWMIEFTTTGSAASRSASAKIRFGDLPPSSSVTGITWSAAALLTSEPTSTEPVNDR